jgi:hypothetical protein
MNPTEGQLFTYTFTLPANPRKFINQIKKGKGLLKTCANIATGTRTRDQKIRISNPRPLQSDLTQRPPSYLAQSKRPKIGGNTIASETMNPNERNTSGNTDGSKTK